MQLQFHYYGTIEYDKAVEMMQEKIPEAVQQKKAFVMAMQHPLVYTTGLATRKEDIIDEDLVTVKARRGGSVTLHNTGQLMFYTVLPVSEIAGGLEAFIRMLEACIIETLTEYSVVSFLNKPNSGVYTSQGKIAFIGLGLKQKAIYHGAAISLHNNLADFNPIFSCGLKIPVSRLVDLKPRLLQRSDNLVEEFACKMFSHLEQRFRPREPALFRHETLLAQVRLPWFDMAFRHGQVYFNERRFWEAHEAWEVFWHSYNEGRFKTFLQGLIQLAMGLFKITEKPNVKGATSLLNKAREKLKGNDYLLRYVYQPEQLLEYLDRTLKSLSLFNAEDEENLRASAFKPFILESIFDRQKISEFTLQ